MDNQQKLCPDCNGQMEVGFVFDRDGGALLVQRWLKGTPELGWMHSEAVAGYSVKGRECRLVQTYRCADCGLLRSYAVKETDAPTLLHV